MTDPFGLFATDTVEISHVNSAPIANAGPAQSAPVGTIVVLDASASSDVDEDPLTYTWSLATPKRSAAVLSDPTALQPTFTVDVAGTYRATLVANDGAMLSKAGKTVVTTPAVNAQPLSNAGADQRIIVGQTVHLDGSRSSDPDGQSLGYAWTLTRKPSSSVAALSSATAIRPTFVADVAGRYVASLVVTDTAGQASAADTVTLTTLNVAPVANAGVDQRATVGTVVQLLGSASSDVDGDELAFGWALIHSPAGSVATLSDRGVVNPRFVPESPAPISSNSSSTMAPPTAHRTRLSSRRATCGLARPPDSIQTVTVGSLVAVTGDGRATPTAIRCCLPGVSSRGQRAAPLRSSTRRTQLRALPQTWQVTMS